MGGERERETERDTGRAGRGGRGDPEREDVNARPSQRRQRRVTSGSARVQRAPNPKTRPSPVDADPRLAVDGFANASLRPRLPLFVGVLSADGGFDRAVLLRFADDRASSASSTDRIESGVSCLLPDDMLYAGDPTPPPTQGCSQKTHRSRGGGCVCVCVEVWKCVCEGGAWMQDVTMRSTSKQGRQHLVGTLQQPADAFVGRGPGGDGAGPCLLTACQPSCRY